jgi:hypothetical protein
VATATTCSHGLDAGTCLICATLGTSPAQPVPTKPVPTKPVPTKPVLARPHGDVAERDGRHRPRLGLLGGLLVVVAVLAGAWFLIHLVWTFLHLVELALVGVVCGWAGYRVGVLVGRHRR